MLNPFFCMEIKFLRELKQHVISLKFSITLLLRGEKGTKQLTAGTVVSCLILRKTPISPLLESICTGILQLIVQRMKQIAGKESGITYSIQIT